MTCKDHSKENNLLANFKGILEVKHHIPGRIRMSCPNLKNNKDKSIDLVNVCDKIPGIISIRINENLGTILIEYDTDVLQPLLIIGIILKVMELEDTINKSPTSLIDKESANLADSLNRAIFEKTNGIVDLKSFVMLLLGAYAAYDINSRPTVRPSGYTCLWWIYSTLAKKI